MLGEYLIFSNTSQAWVFGNKIKVENHEGLGF
jgi:hypothetical protein